MSSGRTSGYGLMAASNQALRTMIAAKSTGCHGADARRPVIDARPSDGEPRSAVIDSSASGGGAAPPPGSRLGRRLFVPTAAKLAEPLDRAGDLGAEEERDRR